jgi:hypothetical protein
MTNLPYQSPFTDGWTRAWRQLAVLLAATALCAATPALAARQADKPATSSAGKPFVGTWKASFKGTPFLTLTLLMTGTKLSGSLSHAEVAWDDEGNVASAKPQPGSKPIANIRLQGDTLFFDSTTDHPMHLALKLKDKARAELSILNSPPGSPTLKPIDMARDTPKP